MVSILKALNRFNRTGERISEDESLAEHDKKYHGGHFDPKEENCTKRDNLAKKDGEDNVHWPRPSIGLPKKREVSDYPKDPSSVAGKDFQKWLDDMDEKAKADIPEDWVKLLEKHGYDVVGNRDKDADGDDNIDYSSLISDEQKDVVVDDLASAFFYDMPERLNIKWDGGKFRGKIENFSYGGIKSRFQTALKDANHDGVKVEITSIKITDQDGNPSEGNNEYSILGKAAKETVEFEGRATKTEDLIEHEKRLEKMRSTVLNECQKALEGQSRYEARIMRGKRNFESGSPYEVIAIYDKKLGISELTFDCAEDYANCRSSVSGEYKIKPNEVAAEVKNYIS